MAKPARGRPASPSGSDSRSFSRSRYRSRSYYGSSSRSRSRSRSRSGSSRSPSPAPPGKSSAEGVKRGRSPPPQIKKTSPPPRKAPPVHESHELHVDQLSRNVKEHHLKEISDPKGIASVEFKNRAEAEKAQSYTDGAPVDGEAVRVKLHERTSPPKAVYTTSRRDALKGEDTVADGERDGGRRPREVSPRRKQLSPPRRRSPGPRRGSPSRDQDSPPPPRRRPDSPPYRRDDSSPIRRRPPSPGRGRSSFSPPKRHRPPLRSYPNIICGSPVRW